jgi:RNA polymerase sigma factor (sigma-70 family)
MKTQTSGNLSRHFAVLFEGGSLTGLGEGQLLERFLAHRDDVAFAELIARHGPMVLDVCRRWLDDPHDVEDAFQATFLILVRKAGSLRDRTALSSWLYGVSLRVARRARSHAARRRSRERPMAFDLAQRCSAATKEASREVRAILDEELARLPESQRTAVVLCLVEGLTHEEAARSLGWPLGTVKSRLAAARKKLVKRLTRRGLAPGGIAIGTAFGELRCEAAVPTDLARRTLNTALYFVTETSIEGGAVPASIASLVRGVIGAMAMTRLKSIAIVLAALGTVVWAAPAFLVARQDPPLSQPRSSPTSKATSPTSSALLIDRYGDPLPPGASLRLGTVRFRRDGTINRIVYSPDGKFVVTDLAEKFLQVWDAQDGRMLRRLDVGIENFCDFRFSPDGKTIAAVGSQLEPEKRLPVYRVTFVDFATGRQLAKSEWHQQRDVWRLAFSPDGKTVATSGAEGFRLWNIATCEQLLEVLLKHTIDRSIDFSPDPASHLLAFTDDAAVCLWDLGSKKVVRRLNHDENEYVTCFAFSFDGTRVASAGRIGEVRLWKVDDGSLLHRFKSQALKPRAHYIPALSFSPDGTALAATFQTGNLVLWDMMTGRESQPFPTCTLVYGPLAFSPDGQTIATRGGTSVLHLWDRTTGKDRLATPDAHEDIVGALLFLDGGKTLVSGSDDRTVRIWDLTGSPGRGTHQRMVLRHQGWVRTMAVSPDEKMLVTGTSYPGEDSVYLWDLTTGDKRWTIPSRGAGIHPVAVQFSLRGDAVTAGWSDGTVRSWDVVSRRETSASQPAPAEGAGKDFPGNSVHTGVLSPDGKKMGTIGKAGVRITDLANSPRAVTSQSGNAMAVSPDGKTVVIAARGRAKQITLADGRTRSDGTRADSTISWVDSESGQERREIVIPESYVNSLAFSPDGHFVAAGTSFQWERGVIHIYRLRDKKEVQTIPTPCRPTLGLAFTPDGKQLVAGMSDTSILIWDLHFDLK